LSELQSEWRPSEDKPDESPETTLRALWLAAIGRPCSEAAAGTARTLPLLDGDSKTRLRDLIRRRRDGEPLAYLTGWQRFLGIDLRCDERALIPRRETELLARAAIETARHVVGARGSALVLDVCTGTGNVALAIAAHVERAVVYAADLSPDAVALAQWNATELGLAGRVSFWAGDLFAPFEGMALDGRVDLVTCNPPYIPSSRVIALPREIAAFEPAAAFDGGTLGMDIVMGLIGQTPRLLRTGGALCVEIGRGQGTFVRRRMERSGRYASVEALSDESGETRVLRALSIGPVGADAG
jgi:release factor glutamine methyltransferase